MATDVRVKSDEERLGDHRVPAHAVLGMAVAALGPVRNIEFDEAAGVVEESPVDDDGNRPMR